MTTRRIRNWSALACVTVGIATTASAQRTASPPATAPAVTAGSVEPGRKAFVSYGCYQCHGYEAQGSNATGPRLGPRPLPFASFSRYVRQPSGQMPPYTSRVLSDSVLTDVYAFVQSRPAAAQNVPLLK